MTDSTICTWIPCMSGWQKVVNANTDEKLFIFTVWSRKMWTGSCGKDSVWVWVAVERGLSGRDKARVVVGTALTAVTACVCFVYTQSVRSCQTGKAQAWSEQWLIAQVQVEFTGGLRYHWQNEWQTQNRVMEYYQEAICNAGQAWISEGCCLSEMKSSITSASYLIRPWEAFKRESGPLRSNSHRWSLWC